MEVGCKAKEAVNGWFADLVSSAADPIFDLLHATVLGTPDIDDPGMARARDLWGVSQTIANTCFVLVITIGGVLVMAGHSLPGTELTPGQLLARLVAAFLASNLSLILIGHAITLANGLSGAFLTAGGKSLDPSVVADVIAGYIAAQLVPLSMFPALIALGTIVLALCVAFIYVVRLAITMVLIAAAPLALMFHALPATDGLARLWWRGMTGILAIQVCQSLVLATAFRLLFTETEDTSGSFFGIPAGNDVTDLLLAACLLWLMVRIPTWVARTVWRPAQPGLTRGLLKTLVLYRGLGALGGLVARHRAPTTARFGQPPLSPQPESTSSRRALPGPSRPPLALTSGPPPTQPTGGAAPPDPPDGPASDPDGGSNRGGHPMQLTLPIPVPPRPAAKRPVQLALPIPATRVPRRPSQGEVAASARPRVRSGQLMLPGMPRRPVPHRQMTLWTDPPKNRRQR